MQPALILALCLTAFQDPQPATAVDVLADLIDTKPAEVVASGTVTTEALGGGGFAWNYCQSSPNSFGTLALIGYTGSLDLSHGSFGLMVNGCPPVASSFGMFTYGRDPYNTPFGNGYLCVSPFTSGIYHMTPQGLGTGAVACSMLTHPAEFSLFQPGDSWNFQFWYRNPQALSVGAPTTFNLSDALHVDFAPSL